MAGSGVFISYRHDDSQSAAGRLADSLERRFGSAQIFRDVETLQPGVDFVEAIEGALSSCSVVLAVIGRRWMGDGAGQNRLKLANDWIRLEIATALKRGIRVIPVLVEGAPPPADDDLPDDLKPLARRHALTLSDARWDYDVQQLSAALESAGVRPLAAPPNNDGPVKPPPPAPSRFVKPLAWIGGIFVGLIVVGAVIEQFNPHPPVQLPMANPAPAVDMSDIARNVRDDTAAQAVGWATGTPTSMCGCWGYTEAGVSQPNTQCASGYHVVAMCAAYCAAGGYQWQTKCM